MGDFRLGCVLGAYDKAQSFDVASFALSHNINSWQQPSVNRGLLFTTETHSSGQGLLMYAHSMTNGNRQLNYVHNEDNDMYARQFPDVTTHDLISQCWAKMGSSAHSGEVSLQLVSNLNAESPIEFSDSLAYKTVSTIVHSKSGNIITTFQTNGDFDATTRSTYADDVITQIDPITLHPNWGMDSKARLKESNHMTLGGARQQYTWNKTYEWSVPLSSLSDSHTDLINWWWQNQFILAWTLDTSDSESTFLARIGNTRQPIGARRRSDNSLFEGVLQLEAITDGRLVF